MKTKSEGIYAKYIKRILDFVLSLFLIILLSPLLLALAVLVRVKLGKPVLFSQLRPGYHEHIFRMYKFRSMTDARDAEGNLLPDDQRLPSFGVKLRDTSLDELPELFCILKGNMSFVGPRPQLVKDMVFMSAEQRQRHTVRPGLTGLAQINGRNAISWEKKLAYDVQYIQNVTFLNDLKIFFGTFAKVFNHDDISAEGMLTALDYGDALLKEGKITEKEYRLHLEEAQSLIEQAERKK